MSTDKKSYLEIFVGPMFSKKTSRLIDIYKQYTFCNIPVEIINHCADTRYHDTMLSSHDKVMVPCIQTDKISEVWFKTPSTVVSGVPSLFATLTTVAFCCAEGFGSLQKPNSPGSV